ncbi:MAG: hypothetical protein M3Y64_00390 [Gemmatimonadota bacterium]|nr:hypothetical protein [Gemmatimonadota bacterium]
MSQIRVVIASMPRLLHDIVHSVLSAESDIVIADSRASTREIPAADALRHTDVVIVAEPEFAEMDYESMLYQHPRVRVVAIAGDGREAALYELRPARIALGELSPQTLVQAVRSHTRGLPVS